MALYKSEMNSGGEGQLTETLLWENSYPTSDWDNNTLTLSESLQNYKYLRFEIKQNKDSDSQIMKYIFDTDFITQATGTSTYYLELGYYKTYGYARMVSCNSNTQFRIGACYRTNQAYSTTSQLIPYRIYGLK